MLYLVLLTPLLGYLLYHLISRWMKGRQQRRRESQAQLPFPPEWREMLVRDFPLYQKLPLELRQKLEQHINVFVREKVFVGCQGFEITHQVRVLIAAQACLLTLNAAENYYPGFETILVYPEAYAATETQRDGYLHTESVHGRAGESWHRGPVIVAWDQVIQGARDGRDGHNVVMHEFAHKLDEQNHYMDGLRVLSDPSQYKPWKEILSEAFEQLQQHRDDVIDAYGATSAAEFFAVVTEAFFEKPHQLLDKHPSLYRQFQLYYQLDPVTWGDDKG